MIKSFKNSIKMVYFEVEYFGLKEFIKYLFQKNQSEHRNLQFHSHSDDVEKCFPIIIFSKPSNTLYNIHLYTYLNNFIRYISNMNQFPTIQYLSHS